MKKNIIQWLKDNHNINNAKYSIAYKDYCGKDNWLYHINVEYSDQDGDIIEDRLYIFVSKKLNDCLNRIRGFNNNKGSNNGIELYYYNIEYYLWNNGKTYINIW